MSIQLVLNISIAFLWMLLNDQWSSMNFLSGYIIGLALIFIMRRFFPTPFYLKKLLAMVKLLLVFLEELILSSIFVIQKVINPKMDFAPGIFSLETHMEGDWKYGFVVCLLH